MKFLFKILAALLVLTSLGQASTLDWNAGGINWPNTQNWSDVGGTSVTATFNNVNASGVDVTITITRGPNTGTGEVDNPNNTPNDSTATPANTSDNPIRVGTQVGLDVDVDFTNRANDFIQYTITFSQNVDAVSFQLWDIDLGNNTNQVDSRYQDIVNGFAGSGGVSGNVTPDSLSLGGGNTDSVIISNTEARGIASDGSTTGYGNENDELGTGIVDVDFGDSVVKTVTFFYRSGSGSDSGLSFPTDPTLQRIALADINFHLIPEPSTWIMSALLGGMILTQILRRKVQWLR